MKYTVTVDGDYLVKFETQGDKISSSFEINGDEVQLDSIKEIEEFLSELFAVAESVAEVSDAPPKITVRVESGKPTKSKKIAKLVKEAESKINQAYIEAEKRLEVDREISTLMQKSIERDDEEQDLIALLVA